MEQRFPVRPRTGSMVAAVVFFALCGAVCFGLALGGHHDGRIGAFVVGPTAERVIGLVCGVFSVGFVLLGCWGLVAYRKGGLELVIDDLGVTAPGPVWRLEPRTVRFADVTAFRVQNISGQEIVTLVAPTAKVWFSKGTLPPGAYDQALTLVKQRLSTRRF